MVVLLTFSEIALGAGPLGVVLGVFLRLGEAAFVCVLVLLLPLREGLSLVRAFRMMRGLLLPAGKASVVRVLILGLLRTALRHRGRVVVRDPGLPSWPLLQGSCPVRNLSRPVQRATVGVA